MLIFNSIYFIIVGINKLINKRPLFTTNVSFHELFTIAEGAVTTAAETVWNENYSYTKTVVQILIRNGSGTYTFNCEMKPESVLLNYWEETSRRYE